MLLFDNAAMNAREQTVARQMAIQFLDQAAAGNPNIAVMDFGGSLRVSQTFTSDVTRAKQAIARPEGGPLAESTSDFVTRDLLRSLDSFVKNLQGAPGRKTLVFFSPGYVMSSELNARLAPLVGAANRSNVSIYPVNVRSTSALSGGITDVSATTRTHKSIWSRRSSSTTTLTGTQVGMGAGDSRRPASPVDPHC